jgi:hypothetical protein
MEGDPNDSSPLLQLIPSNRMSSRPRALLLAENGDDSSPPQYQFLEDPTDLQQMDYQNYPNSCIWRERIARSYFSATTIANAICSCYRRIMTRKIICTVLFMEKPMRLLPRLRHSFCLFPMLGIPISRYIRSTMDLHPHSILALFNYRNSIESATTHPTIWWYIQRGSGRYSGIAASTFSLGIGA